MRDLQRRLTSLGFTCGAGEHGTYGPSTVAAVAAFQGERGLRTDGVCGRETWGALVEAGFRLGDRLLYLRSPMLRGDDVAELQRRLGALGFDAGRVDGIFGPEAEQALKDFQRNVGLTSDGIFGPESRRVLERVSAKAGAGRPLSVAGVREKEWLRSAPRTLAGRWVVVGQAGGLDQLAAATARALQDSGALVVTLQDPDASIQASTANELGAEVFLSLVVADRCAASYYATAGFESVGGRHLAALIAVAVAPVLDARPCTPTGMTLPILRETKMPAVVCELGPPELLAQRIPALATALGGAVSRWAAEPLEA